MFVVCIEVKMLLAKHISSITFGRFVHFKLVLPRVLRYDGISLRVQGTHVIIAVHPVATARRQHNHRAACTMDERAGIHIGRWRPMMVSALLALIVYFVASCFMIGTYTPGPHANHAHDRAVGNIIRPDRRKMLLFSQESSHERAADRKYTRKGHRKFIRTREKKHKVKLVKTELEKRGEMGTANDKLVTNNKLSTDPMQSAMHVVTVACGQEVIPETITWLKSVLLLSGKSLHVYLFIDDDIVRGYERSLLRKINLPDELRARLHIYRIEQWFFPAPIWREVFKRCSTLRLFLPYVLDDLQRIIYTDVDVIFHSPVEHLWAFWDKMNSIQMTATAIEDTNVDRNWYINNATHPYYDKYGINTGVMLMDLAKMRKTNWKKKMIGIYERYHQSLWWGDQDILNIYFHSHADELYILPCEWNYRPDLCMWTRPSPCEGAYKHGIPVIHGNRDVFHNNYQILYKGIFSSWLSYNLSRDVHDNLIRPLRESIRLAYKATLKLKQNLMQPVTKEITQLLTARNKSSHAQENQTNVVLKYNKLLNMSDYLTNCYNLSVPFLAYLERTVGEYSTKPKSAEEEHSNKHNNAF